MDRNKKHFIDFLCGKATKNVIFEPYITRELTEALIWRRGGRLWSTPEQCISTLASCTERTRADMFFLDLNDFTEEEKAVIPRDIIEFKKRDAELGVGVICHDAEEVALVEGVADCLCIYGGAGSDKLPVIRMDGTPEDAIARGDLAWFATSDAEAHLAAHGEKIKILGGLGVDFIVESSPVRIYSYVEELAEIYPHMWACGSGGEIPGDKYLEFISLLGAFGRIRRLG
ncbi:MAG: hypothetical protein IKV54_07280 [Clostridia bacterium]|nr:hypothetical protein [Clostridia bacterium]